jgi:hypothetical protein
VKNSLPEASWVNFFAIFAFFCIATRIISGVRGRQRVQDPAEPRRTRLAPYWFPWFGNSPFFAWNHASLFESLRLVPNLSDDAASFSFSNKQLGTRWVSLYLAFICVARLTIP